MIKDNISYWKEIDILEANIESLHNKIEKLKDENDSLLSKIEDYEEECINYSEIAIHLKATGETYYILPKLYNKSQLAIIICW